MSLISYANQGATRSLPLSPELEAALNAAGLAIGAERIIVHSGGQPTAEEGGPRTGSTRHDHGGAGDIEIIVGGRSLNFSDPNDQPLATQFVQAASQQGLTGFGQGDDYMGPNRIHVGYGTPAVWGANGASANAPEWLLAATGGTPAPTVAASPAPQPQAPAQSDPGAVARIVASLQNAPQQPQEQPQITMPELNLPRVRDLPQGAGMPPMVAQQQTPMADPEALRRIRALVRM